jgi:hypothetical protein
MPEFLLLALLPFLLLILAVVLFWILTLIDCIKRDYEKESDKIVWVLVIIF